MAQETLLAEAQNGQLLGEMSGVGEEIHGLNLRGRIFDAHPIRLIQPPEEEGLQRLVLVEPLVDVEDVEGIRKGRVRAVLLVVVL